MEERIEAGDGEWEQRLDPVAHVGDVAERAGVSEVVVEEAERVVSAYVGTNRHQGRMPSGVAAGGLLAVLEAADRSPDVMEWEEPADVSHPTLRKRLDEMREFVEVADVERVRAHSRG